MLDSKWLKMEQQRIAEHQHPINQPEDLDLDNSVGSDLNSPYERRNRVKGL